MKFLNGWKTIIGVVVSIATPIVAAGGDLGKVGAKILDIVQHGDAVVAGAAALLTTLGIIHKVEKSDPAN